jgi:hypothetical protein
MWSVPLLWSVTCSCSLDGQNGNQPLFFCKRNTLQWAQSRNTVLANNHAFLECFLIDHVVIHIFVYADRGDDMLSVGKRKVSAVKWTKAQTQSDSSHQQCRCHH